MVVFAVEFHQFRLKVGADTGEDVTQVVENFLGKHFAPVFGYEDQMHM